MKMQIIVDTAGNIIGTAQPRQVEAGDQRSPTNFKIIAEPGQQVFEVDVPDEVAMSDPLELHKNYQLEIKPITAQTQMVELRYSDPEK